MTTSEEHKNGHNKKSTAEYFAGLEKWLQDAYMWQCVNAWLPYMLMSQQQQQTGTFTQNPASSPQAFVQNTVTNNAGPQPFTRQTNIVTPLGVQYRIPPLWKRFAAEFLDFLILFSMKLVITLLAVDVFEFIDLEKYDIEVLQSSSKLSYQMALEMTTEILILEMAHRVVVCFYEAFCLYQGSEGRIGGATPGKNTLGIKVIKCKKVTPGPAPNVVYVLPATDLGFHTAFARSFLKSFIIAFFFPICLTMLLFKHNRSAYDVFCKTIVVEEQDPRPMFLPRQQR